MATEYTATVNLGDSSITAKSDDADDIMRLLALAGVQHKEETPHAEIAMSPQGIEMMPMMSGMENECSSEEFTGEVVEQADYDYGDAEVSGTGHEVNPSTYIWKGPKLPQRQVKGFAGDNALVSEVYAKLSDAYEEFLAEADDRENAEGNMSPLSDPTKPEFDKDPMHGETPVDDGSHSPISTIKRQPALK